MTSAERNYRTIIACPVLTAMALHGMDMIMNEPLAKEVVRLYNMITAYPSGYVWIMEYDSRHRDDYKSVDGNLFDRKRARSEVRRFRKHLGRRRRLLMNALARLERGEPCEHEQN